MWKDYRNVHVVSIWYIIQILIHSLHNHCVYQSRKTRGKGPDAVASLLFIPQFGVSRLVSDGMFWVFQGLGFLRGFFYHCFCYAFYRGVGRMAGVDRNVLFWLLQLDPPELVSVSAWARVWLDISLSGSLFLNQSVIMYMLISFRCTL